MVHWSQKLGYTCSAMTGNFFKLSEYLLFNWVNNDYDLGGPMIHGEIAIVLGIVLFSFLGASVAVIVTKYHEFDLVPSHWHCSSAPVPVWLSRGVGIDSHASRAFPSYCHPHSTAEP